jgi:hypothetical protein
MRALICVLAAAVVVGCGSDTTQPTVDLTLAPTSTDVAGAFNLVSANGTAPPFPAFATATADWTLAADTVAITAANTWTEATTYFVTSLLDGTTTTQFSVVAGTYAIADGKINFTMTQGGTEKFIGSVTGSTLTIIYTGTKFIYTKSQ